MKIKLNLIFSLAIASVVGLSLLSICGPRYDYVDNNSTAGSILIDASCHDDTDELDSGLLMCIEEVSCHY